MVAQFIHKNQKGLILSILVTFKLTSVTMMWLYKMLIVYNRNIVCMHWASVVGKCAQLCFCSSSSDCMTAKTFSKRTICIDNSMYRYRNDQSVVSGQFCMKTQ